MTRVIKFRAWDRGYYTGYITATVLILMIYGDEK